MCGVAGIVGRGAGEMRSAVERMLEAMRYRGPDGGGTYVSPSGNCVLGHRRLSILDLSEAAAQPMLSPDQRFALSYNGEIYNFSELRAKLPDSEKIARSSGDTEVLLRMLAQQESRCLDELNGMFVFAFWDEAQQKLLVARDGFGQKPLYYARVGELLVFASEQKALLASGLVKKDLDIESTLSFLSYGWCQEPATMLREVKTLPHGYFLRVELGQSDFEPSNYSVASVGKRACGPEELRDLFGQAVSRTLVSDAPIGLFLSGGIDSSAVAAAASKASGKSLHTLTVTFPDSESDSEGIFAREIADRWGTRHTEVPISGSEMLRLLPRSLAAMDQPSMDGTNTYLVAYGARQVGLKAALSGLGGDELFGGYASFGDLPRILEWRSKLGLLSPLITSALDFSPRWNRRLGKSRDIFLEPGDLAHQYFVRRQVFSDRQLEYLAPSVVSDFSKPYLDPDLLAKLQAVARESALSDAIGFMESNFYMCQILLRDSDVMGMAHSLEIRNPFLDKEFSRRVQAMGAETRKFGPSPKRAFVEAMGDWLPESCSRPKKCFALPFKHWLLDELRSEVDQGLRTLGAQIPWIDQKAVDELWENFQKHPDQVGWARPWLLFVLSHYLRSLAEITS